MGQGGHVGSRAQVYGLSREINVKGLEAADHIASTVRKWTSGVNANVQLISPFSTL